MSPFTPSPPILRVAIIKDQLVDLLWKRVAYAHACTDNSCHKRSSRHQLPTPCAKPIPISVFVLFRAADRTQGKKTAKRLSVRCRNSQGLFV